MFAGLVIVLDLRRRSAAFGDNQDEDTIESCLDTKMDEGEIDVEAAGENHKWRSVQKVCVVGGRMTKS